MNGTLYGLLTRELKFKRGSLFKTFLTLKMPGMRAQHLTGAPRCAKYLSPVRIIVHRILRVLVW